MRPTEYPELFTVIMSTAVEDLDVDALMNDREAFIESVYRATNRRDLTFGNILWQTKWK